jgi:hypothetical protein
MLPYANPEAFYDFRTDPPVADTLAATKDVAVRLAPIGTRHEVNAGTSGVDGDTLDFTYLDRELVTTRTTSSRRQPHIQLPDHQLRLDLLLASPGGVPIVGEIKIKRDRDLSYALIQALASVALLSTPDQVIRLATHYAPYLAAPPGENPPFYIYLVAVPVPTETHI